MKRTHVAWALVLLGVAAGCGDDETTAAAAGTGGAGGDGGFGGVELLGGQDCDPMVPSHCGYPFPSNVYTVEDGTTPTGLRVRFGETTLPLHNGAPIDPAWFAAMDGFSPGQAPMTHLPGATVAGLPSVDDIALSLSKESPTVILEADTGRAVPHFAELDMSTDDDLDRAFMLRPAVRLADATRYIVAIRRVVDAEGEVLPTSEVFAALRDGKGHEDPSVEARRALYEDIFERLHNAGYDTRDLQLAWDFTTASRENNTRWMLAMRDHALAQVGEEGPEYSIESIEENPNQHIAKRIHAKMTVPLYLDSAEPGGKIHFDADGLPAQNGTAEFDVLIHVPKSIATGAPHGLLQNGHGLLGSRREGQNGYLAQIANTKKYIAFSVDLVGFAGDDENTVIDAIVTDIGKFQYVIERQHQGMINSLLAMRMMKGRFVDDPNVAVNGQSVIDPEQAFYRGDSQGGIMGGTYMALSTDVERGLLGEPGMPYNLLLNRAKPFVPFFVLLQSQFPAMLDVQLVLGLVQMMWDRAEPNGYFPYVTDNTLPGTPSHQVLMHVAIGDQQVTPLGAHLMARTIGAKTPVPFNRRIWGVEEATAPFAGNAIVEFRFPGVPENPKINVPPSEPDSNDPHDWVRVLDASIDQTDAFLRQGTVTWTCDSLCDPE